MLFRLKLLHVTRPLIGPWQVGSISNFLRYGSMCKCAKFHAFNTKCTYHCLSRPTIMGMFCLIDNMVTCTYIMQHSNAVSCIL